MGVALVLAAGCASSSSKRASADAPPEPAWAKRISVDGAVGTYTSSPWGFSTKSYWIEGRNGVVLVDTQFLPSAAIELYDAAVATTGAPVVAAIVLHANPDKFNGTAALQERGVEVLTSAQVAALIPAVHAKRTAAFAERYAPDYPTEIPAPDVFGAEPVTIERAGLTLRLIPLGAGCSAAHVALFWDGHVFVGDLVSEGTHAWMELGRLAEWREALASVSQLQATHVHPGRGESGGPALIDAQFSYFDTVDALVASALAEGLEKKAAVARVAEGLRAAYPDHGFPVFLRIGLPAVVDRAIAARSTPSLTRPWTGTETPEAVLVE